MTKAGVQHLAMVGVRHGVGQGRKKDPRASSSAAPQKPAPKEASLRRKEQRLAQKARSEAGIAPPPPGPKRAPASPRLLGDGREGGTWMRERSPAEPLSANSRAKLNDRRRKTQQRAEAAFDATTERELRAKGELPAPKKPKRAIQSAVAASTTTQSSQPEGTSPATAPESRQLHPRNERNRALFRCPLSRDPATGAYVHGVGCRAEFEVLRDYYFDKLQNMCVGSLGCPTCVIKFEKTQRPAVCPRSSGVRAYVQGRRTKEMDEFFSNGGVTPHNWDPNAHVQWDMSQAPEECVSVSTEAQQELRLEMAERRFRFFLAHAVTGRDVLNSYERPEQYFEHFEHHYQGEWRCGCVRGTPIPDDDMWPYLEARREERRAQAPELAALRYAAYEEGCRETQKYPWCQKLASARASQQEG